MSLLGPESTLCAADRSVGSLPADRAAAGSLPANARPTPFFLTGTLRAMAEPNTVGDPQAAFPVDHAIVSADGAGQGITDDEGRFRIEVPEELDYVVTARLRGIYCEVTNDAGPSAVLHAIASPGTDLDLLFDDFSSTIAERDAYVHVNIIHDWIQAADPGFTALDYPLSVHVNNGNATCGAMWNPDGLTFYREGGGCNNTGRISDAVYHEYAHGITRGVYGPEPPPVASGMDEAFSDFAAMTIHNDAEFAEGFLVGGGWIRTGENYRQYPGSECGGSVFCLSEILSGAMWKFRKNLNIRYGPDDAARIAAGLHVRTMANRETTMPSYLISLLQNDDDDGDLGNLTPHYHDICEAFAVHALPCPPLTDYVVVESEPVPDNPWGAPQEILATVEAVGGGAIDPDSVEIRYALCCGPGDVPEWKSAPMEPTGRPLEVRGEIPLTAATRFVKYYVRAAKVDGISGTAPPQAPHRGVYEFMAGPAEVVLQDDAEIDRGWRLGWSGDDAVEGIWERADPTGKTSADYGATQPEDDHTQEGALCFVTDARGGAWSAHDVDGGRTSLVSPPLPSLEDQAIGSVRFWSFFFDRAPVDDTLRCSVSYDDGESWGELARIQGIGANQWTHHRVYFQRTAGEGPVRIRFSMEDRNEETVCAEAAVDDIQVIWNLSPGCVSGLTVPEPAAAGRLSVVGANPSPGRFALRWSQAKTGPVAITVHDAAGRVVRRLLSEDLPAGAHPIQWDALDDDGRQLGSGVYFLRARAGRDQAGTVLVLIR